MSHQRGIFDTLYESVTIARRQYEELRSCVASMLDRAASNTDPAVGMGGWPGEYRVLAEAIGWKAPESWSEVNR